MPHDQMTSFDNSCSHENDDHHSLSINHTVQFYEDTSHMAETVASLSYTALQKNSAVIIVAVSKFIKIVESSLQSRIKDFSLLKEQGQIKLLDAHAMLNQLMVNDAPDPVRFNQHIVHDLQITQARFKNVWIYGEMVNILWQRGNVASALQLEKLWNELAQKISFDLICGYQITNFKNDLEGKLFNAVCYEHNAVLPGESFLNLTEQEAQYRNVASLQQKNQALINEIILQKEIEKLLTALVDEKTQQIYNISHEIKTPLTAIILQTTALLRVFGKGQNEENNKIIYKLMADIKVNTQRLNHLIHDLINIKSKTP